MASHQGVRTHRAEPVLSINPAIDCEIPGTVCPVCFTVRVLNVPEDFDVAAELPCSTVVKVGKRSDWLRCTGWFAALTSWSPSLLLHAAPNAILKTTLIVDAPPADFRTESRPPIFCASTECGHKEDHRPGFYASGIQAETSCQTTFRFALS
jgi:hypothetical protein